MLDVTVVPIGESPLRWLADSTGRALSTAHLEQIRAVDAASAKRLMELTEPWYREQPFTPGYFAEVASIPIDGWGGAEAVGRVRKWLYGRDVPFGHPVVLSWDAETAALTNWKMVVKYWDELWNPSDDLAVFDESLSWALFLWHEGEAFFASRPTGGSSAR